MIKKKIKFIFKGGRIERIPDIKKGIAPSDFFYGSYALKHKNYEIQYLSLDKIIVNKYKFFFEYILSNLNKLGISKTVIQHIGKSDSDTKLIVSFSDGLSLSLGTLRNRKIKTLGCFHRLSELENHANIFTNFWSNQLIKNSLNRLDHIAFFGSADREYAISKYKIDKDKTSIILFGVDTNFWKLSKVSSDEYFFSIGQDPSRDFDTLVNTKKKYKLKIHTDLRIKCDRDNIVFSKGNFYKNGLTDVELRKLYQKSIAVIIPLKDVYQPSGYSVALQAMSCGKTVIITKNKGFWAPDIFKNYINCIFVRPGNINDLNKAMQYVYDHPEKRKTIGLCARQTVKKYFDTIASKNSLKEIIEKTLIN